MCACVRACVCARVCARVCSCLCVCVCVCVAKQGHQEVTGCRQLGCDHGGVAEVGESGDDTTLPQRKVIKHITDGDIHEA